MADSGERKSCSYYVVRYVPNVEREEFLNIGLFLHCQEEQYLDCLFTDDFQRVKRFHPHADIAFLKELQGHFESEIQGHDNDLAAYIGRIEGSYSNLIQLTHPRPTLTTDPEEEIHRLFARYVGEQRAASRATDTRLAVKRQLVNALRRARVLSEPRFEKHIAAERWTEKGDPFHFDFGYRPLQVGGKINGHLKLIHALYLNHEDKLPHVLANTIRYVRGHEAADLTAVVEAIPAGPDKPAWHSYRLLRDADINVLPLEEVNAFAVSISHELQFGNYRS